MSTDVMTSAVVVHALVKCLREHGVASEEIERQTGIILSELDNPDHMISLTVLLQLWILAVDKSADPALGIHIREAYGSNLLHFSCYIAINSENGLAALDHFIRYADLICEAHQFELINREGLVTIKYSNTSTVHQNPWIPEHNFSSLVYFSRQLIHETMCPKTVTFQHVCQTDPKLYLDFFKSPVLFEQNENKIMFQESLLLKPLIAPNPHLQAVLKEQAETALALQSDGRQMTNRVKRYIASNLSSGDLSLESTAAVLSLSRSSLYRALNKEGTSFKKLLQETRMSLAESYLKQEMKTTQIACLTGYSDISSFLNAFKVWFGVSPGIYRQKLIRPV